MKLNHSSEARLEFLQSRLQQVWGQYLSAIAAGSGEETYQRLSKEIDAVRSDIANLKRELPATQQEERRHQQRRHIERSNSERRKEGQQRQICQTSS